MRFSCGTRSASDLNGKGIPEKHVIGGRWSDAFAVILLVLFILLFPITWPLSQLWRSYRLKSRGYYVTREGRDAIEYQELYDGKVRRLTIPGEMVVKGPHVVYVPTEGEWQQWMPSWAQGRREEIVEKLRCSADPLRAGCPEFVAGR